MQESAADRRQAQTAQEPAGVGENGLEGVRVQSLREQNT